MSKYPTVFDENEPQAQAAEGAMGTIGTATNDTQDRVPEGSRDATATNGNPGPMPEASSDESDGVWRPNMTQEEFVAEIPLRNRLLMDWAGKAVQQKRNQK